VEAYHQNGTSRCVDTRTIDKSPSLPDIHRQHCASVKVAKSMQSMCMVSIIEPDSSSKYLGSLIKTMCSSSFQSGKRRIDLTYLHDDCSPAPTTKYCTSPQSALSPVMSVSHCLDF